MSRSWPPITQPDLLAHQDLDEAGFEAFMRRLVTTIPAREFTDEVYRHGLAYPWARPRHSFRLDGDEIDPLDTLAEDPAEDGARFPLLAFGANGAPERLRLKLSALPAPDRRLTGVVGRLHDFDVVATAHPALYGALPATLHPSPGTAMTATLLWVSIAQLTVLATTEFTYRLGALDPARFESDLPGAAPVTRVYAFVSRIGALGAAGGPYALAAVPAQDRTLPALDQEELLTRVARLGYGPEETAAGLVARIMSDFAAVAHHLRPLVLPSALPFACEQWTPFAAGG
jgi:hypothetical protein